MILLKMSQPGRRYCWIEKGVLLDLWATPRLSMCIVVETGDFTGGINAWSRAQSAYMAPKNPQASVQKEEISKYPLAIYYGWNNGFLSKFHG